MRSFDRLDNFEPFEFRVTECERLARPTSAPPSPCCSRGDENRAQAGDAVGPTGFLLTIGALIAGFLLGADSAGKLPPIKKALANRATDSDPKNLELRKEKKMIDEITGWLVKDAGRRAARDAGN